MAPAVAMLPRRQKGSPLVTLSASNRARLNKTHVGGAEAPAAARSAECNQFQGRGKSLAQRQSVCGAPAVGSSARCQNGYFLVTRSARNCNSRNRAHVGGSVAPAAALSAAEPAKDVLALRSCLRGNGRLRLCRRLLGRLNCGRRITRAHDCSRPRSRQSRTPGQALAM